MLIKGRLNFIFDSGLINSIMKIQYAKNQHNLENFESSLS